MKIKILILFIISLLFIGCNSKVELENAIKISNKEELKNDELYFMIYDLNGCPACNKLKNTINKNDFVLDNPEYNFFTVNRNDSLYKNLYKTKELNHLKGLFPTTYIFKKENNEIKVLYSFIGNKKEKFIENLIKIYKNENIYK